LLTAPSPVVSRYGDHRPTPSRFLIDLTKRCCVEGSWRTRRAAAYPQVLDELIRSALHTTEQYANNRVDAEACRVFKQ
jgi:hypothetical protein